MFKNVRQDFNYNGFIKSRAFVLNFETNALDLKIVTN